MPGFLNAIYFLATSSGTGSFTPSSAVQGYRILSTANGAVVGRTYAYRAESSSLNEWEIGVGTWNGTVLARTTVLYNHLGNTTTISFTAAPNVGVVELAEDLRLVNLPFGRLTLQSGVPFMTTSQASKTRLYYNGSQCSLYDGAHWLTSVIPGGEIFADTTDTTKSPAAIGANKINDWFYWDDAGTPRIGHGPDWTDDTTRSAGTALTLVNGVYLNAVAITNGPGASRGTYIGSTRSDGSSQLNWLIGGLGSGGVAARLDIWTAYSHNRRLFTPKVVDSGASYTYVPTTIRQARGSAGNQIAYLSGLAEDGAFFSYTARLDTVAVSGAYCYFVPALDSTTSSPSLYTICFAATAAGNSLASMNAITVPPLLGYHYVAMLEGSDGTHANTFGIGASNTLSGIVSM